jgi:hypothetical protein
MKTFPPQPAVQPLGLLTKNLKTLCFEKSRGVLKVFRVVPDEPGAKSYSRANDCSFVLESGTEFL